MEEEINKPKRGRPKGSKNKPKTPEKKRDGRGGRREGAGRKKGVAVGPYKGNDAVLSENDTFRVSPDTHRRIKQLREMTKQDTMPFNRMFESWVEDLAKEYGID